MSFLGELELQCVCCRPCGQHAPCDGVQAGGMCDDLCECDQNDLVDAEEYWDEHDEDFAP